MNYTKLESSYDDYDLIFPVPRPNNSEISLMTGAYYDEAANHYDAMEQSQLERMAGISTTNYLVADELKSRGAKSIFSIGSGTGEREGAIAELCSEDVRIIASDISTKMCALARSKGLETRLIQTSKLPIDLIEKFDAFLMLLSFGHLASTEQRRDLLSQIRSYLNPGGILCLDASNLNNLDENGPKIIKEFERLNLQFHGYEPGEFFFSQKNSSVLCYWKYFTKIELEKLLTSAGYKLLKFYFINYGKQPGRIVTEDQGKIFLVAQVQ
jgi:SAM-dependent methyltransferase